MMSAEVLHYQSMILPLCSAHQCSPQALSRPSDVYSQECQEPGPCADVGYTKCKVRYDPRQHEADSNPAAAKAVQ